MLFRVRPLILQEQDFAWDVSDNTVQLLPSLQQDNSSTPFEFTKVFDERATNQDIFEQQVQPLVKQLMNGYNCTVIAYGQSASGKTSTMFKGPL